ncbi:Phage integrase family [Popillia japonica]|uniref:Phage integrase family n=1 Tax=Popillia japonica TaxID=7064 RepID=A0AAW1HT58_POPJA
MAKAKKLPSGQWRTLVYNYTDTNGKRHYESFTAETKKESEYLAAEFALSKEEHTKCSYTFEKARKKYIESKNNILSPSTIRGYQQMSSYYLDIDDIRIKDFTSKLVGAWVNDFSKTHSPKTVRNGYALVSAVLKEYAPNLHLSIALPQRVKVKCYVPTDNDVQAIIRYYSGHDTDMLLSVYLAAFGTLRRSEICALTADDVVGNTIHVNKAMVKNTELKYEIKTTKTVSSDRYVSLPDFVVELFPSSGNIVSTVPDTITKKFNKTLSKLQIPRFRFHDLRHYSASIMHAIGVPDQYIMQRGGWGSDIILKQIYRGTMDDYQQKFTDMTNDHFNNMQHEMQHKK